MDHLPVTDLTKSDTSLSLSFRLGVSSSLQPALPPVPLVTLPPIAIPLPPALSFPHPALPPTAIPVPAVPFVVLPPTEVEFPPIL